MICGLFVSSNGLAASKGDAKASQRQVSAAKSTESPKTWPEGMRKLSQSFSNAFPFVYSPLEISSPGNKEVISEYISRLKSSAHTLPVEQGKLILGDEPLVDVFPKILQSEVIAAEASYKKGSFDEAQQSFKRITNQCFSCHITHRIGPKFDVTNSEVTGFSATLREKVIALIALRQFDSAMRIMQKEFEKISSDQELAIDHVKLYLLMTTIGSDDFSAGEKLVQRLLEKLPVNSPKRELLTYWLGGLTAGRVSVERKLPFDPSKLAADLVSYQKQNRDEFNYVNYMVLSRQLSGSDSKNLAKEIVARNYQSLGGAYQSLAVPEFFLLPWTYFEACAEKSPKTAVAKECYGQAVAYVLGYFKKKELKELPASVQKRLEFIRE
jgi:hypothetical protein